MSPPGKAHPKTSSSSTRSSPRACFQVPGKDEFSVYHVIPACPACKERVDKKVRADSGLEQHSFVDAFGLGALGQGVLGTMSRDIVQQTGCEVWTGRKGVHLQ